MKEKSKTRLIISEIIAVIINVVPLALWFFEDYTIETVMILYALESVLAIIFAVLCVLILAPSGSDKLRLIKGFLLIGSFAVFVILVFPAVFIFLIGKGKGVTFEDVRFGFLIIFGFQLFEFFANLYLLRPLSLKEGEFLMSNSFGGMALIFVSIFIGIFLAAFFNISVFLPFIILKTMVDIGQPIQFFLGQTPSPTE